MPELAAGGQRDAGQLTASAIDYVSEALALVCSRAPATEVALLATTLRELIAELERQRQARDRERLAGDILRRHGDERYNDGVEDGIVAERERAAAEQAAAAENCRDRLRVLRPRRATGAFPVMPQAAGGA